MLADVPGWVEALILGIVQGLTEFLPVSSSAHLVLVPALAGWERHGLAFDVALHLGTLLALLVYYRRDLGAMASAVLGRGDPQIRARERRLVGVLAIASIPVAVVGLGLGDVVAGVFADPVATAWLLFVTAAVLIGGERLHRRHQRGGTTIAGDAPSAPPTDTAATTTTAVAGAPRLTQALIVGGAQCLALLPGLSRSGLTISAGIAAGLSRPEATRFAFLLGLPAIAGAAVVELPRVDDLGGISTTELLIGITAAAVSGYLAIATLVRLVSRVGIDRFAWYVVPLAVVSLFVLR
ncbi:MAG: undecaprenyl-diphosphate phosphatase [Nitriliruptoraceae bacterium]|nr:undecaprenyl-diphosphate phosphatase [Nitriliruptoraceae bacterium]